MFRRMGLPAWTFVGIGISAIWFNYLGTLLEMLFTRLLGEQSPLATWLPPVLVFLLPFVFVLSLWLVQRMRQAARRGVLGRPPFAQPEPKRGLILLVSRVEHAMHAFEYHARDNRLQHVWLIYTGDAQRDRFGPGSAPQAQQIIQACKERCGGRISVVPYREVSPADAQDTFDAVNRIYRTCGLEPEEVIADFTGGTKPMTVGMIMACLRAGRELEYISYNPETHTMHGPYLVDYQDTAFNLLA